MRGVEGVRRLVEAGFAEEELPDAAARLDEVVVVDLISGGA